MTNPDFDMKLDKSWLNPINVLELRTAVKKKKLSVELNGKMYVISYHLDQIEPKVFVRRHNNYAPCGWFTIRELEEYEFEADHDKHL